MLRLLTVPEAAGELRLSRAEIYRLVMNGELPHARVGSDLGRIRISADDLEAYVAKRRAQPRHVPVDTPA